jgi:hypothetical protein
MNKVNNNFQNTENKQKNPTLASISEFNSEFSFYKKPVTNVNPNRKLNLVDTYHLIKGPTYKDVTESYRWLIGTKEGEEFKKENFDYCTFSGIFSSRKDGGHLSHSELLTIDFDHVQDVAELKSKLLKDEYLETELMYVSPSGEGVKFIIRIDLFMGTHKEFFEGVSNYIKGNYGIEIDKSGKDVSRACFLCHDPDVYINPNYLGEVNPKPTKPFDPKKWLDKPTPKSEQKVKEAPVISDTSSHVEEVIQQIEAMRIDLTSSYSDWIKIGFGLADEFGEIGREYFHRVSQFHPNYSWKDCDQQYTNCLKSNGNGVTIGTFFQMCKNEGITFINKKDDKPPQKDIQASTFPKSLYPELPEILKQITDVGTSDAEKDLLLLGSIGVLSACLPNIYGIYGGQKVFPNLYVFITASASAGKGKLNNCKLLVNPIHLELRSEAKLSKQIYDAEMAQFKGKKAKDENLEKPTKPLEKMLFIPANNSASGAYQLLAENDGVGLIFETEGDTLSLAFKTDYGNYSDGFRKAFHHETISYYRKTDKEYVDIEMPRLSVVLSGTPNQVISLIPSAENGLLSRFIFYSMDIDDTWKNVFEKSTSNGLNVHFEAIGKEFHELHWVFKEGHEIKFVLSSNQELEFNSFFKKLQSEYLLLQGEEYVATVRRLGLITFRLCMILSALRLREHGVIDAELTCDEKDFKSALEMVKVLVLHSEKVFSELPMEKKQVPRKNIKVRFLEALPNKFSRQVYLDEAKKLGVADKTADGYIKAFCSHGVIDKERHDQYLKK